MSVRVRVRSAMPRWSQPRRVSVSVAALVCPARSLYVYVPYGVLGSSGPDFGMMVVWINVK